MVLKWQGQWWCVQAFADEQSPESGQSSNGDGDIVNDINKTPMAHSSY
jgi:hypothetical protein